jgi:hypothetical protein
MPLLFRTSVEYQLYLQHRKARHRIILIQVY